MALRIRIRVLDPINQVRCIYKDYPQLTLGAVVAFILADGGITCARAPNPDDKDCQGEAFIPLHRIVCIETLD